jgi:hypothetical protein
MLTKRNWHDFKVNEVLLWSFYGDDVLVTVVGTGPNYVSIIRLGETAKIPHPLRLWEKELEGLSRIKTTKEKT